MSGISTQAILVELSISVWTSRKRDKSTSDEVLADKQATSKSAASVIKSLFADEPKLAAITNAAQGIRAWHYANTLPWSDTGTRMLPMKNFLTYKRELSELEHKFDEAVEEFLSDYPTLVTAAAFRLGKLFSRAEYPSAKEVRKKFAINYVFIPMPEAGDFRVDAQNEELDELRKQYDESYNQRLGAAMKENWDNLHACLTRLSTQLGFDQGKKKRVYQSMFDAAKSMTSLLTSLNVTHDPALEAARKDLESALVNINAEDVRKHEVVRDQARRSIVTILNTYKDKFTADEDEDDEGEDDGSSVDGDSGSPREGKEVCNVDAEVGGEEQDVPAGESGDSVGDQGVQPDVTPPAPAPVRPRPDFSLLDF